MTNLVTVTLEFMDSATVNLDCRNSIQGNTHTHTMKILLKTPSHLLPLLYSADGKPSGIRIPKHVL